MAETSVNDSSLDRYEREAEHNRATLVHTVDELRSRVSQSARELQHRVSPHAMKEEMLDKARENPLQAIAVGAGVAYPAWKILKNIPVPILLMGAGIALCGRRGRASHSGHGMASGYGGTADHGRYGFRDSPQRDSASMHQRAREAAERVSESAGRASEAVSSRIGEAASAVSDAFSSTARTASESASSAASRLSETASSHYQRGAEAASHAGYHAAETHRYARQSFAQAMDRNPLLVGGIGLAIGALIAASLPATRTENRLFGETSDDVKRRASEAASRGYETAKGAGQRVYEKTMREAEDEGLTAEDAREAAHDVGDRVKSVAGQAAKAAAGSGRNGSSSRGGRDSSGNQRKAGGQR